MAVKASYSITIASINDVESTARYYLLQSSTLAAPSKPTASPPGGSWQTTEPTYTGGSTNSLYFVDEAIFSDGTWAYSDVSLSTSYEAAKAAYNKAAAAQSTADKAQSTAEDAWSRTLRVQVSSSPADAAGDTSTLTATVWRGGERLTEQEVAMMGLVAWYVGGSRVATGWTYTCAAGTAVECRVEA